MLRMLPPNDDFFRVETCSLSLIKLDYRTVHGEMYRRYWLCIDDRGNIGA